MSHPRFSLGALLLMVLSAGVAFAALRSPSDAWVSALFTTAVSVLLVATLAAVHRRDRVRAYWLGFALFGWVSLLLSLVPEMAPRLATTGLLDALFARVHGHGHAGGVTSVAFSPDGRLVAQGAGLGTVRVWDVSTGKSLGILASPNPEGFRGVGHSLLALLFACVGGWVSRHLHATHDRQPSLPPEGSDSVQVPASMSRSATDDEASWGVVTSPASEPRPGHSAR